MKKVMMILAVCMIGLTACDKDEIEPNIVDEDNTTIVDEGNNPEEPQVEISDTMRRVTIFLKGTSKLLPMGIEITHNYETVKVNSNTQDSTIYVTTGQAKNTWNGWVKPDSEIKVYGSIMGGTIHSFESVFRIDYGDDIYKIHTPDNQNYDYEHIVFI